MACLVHNSRYRSLFHAVINELRNEKRMPASILRTMPRQCCTCNNVDNQTLINVLIDDKDKLINLKNLINQIDRDKKSNPKLVLSLNLLENIIKENRILDSKLLSTSTVDNHISKLDDDNDSSKSEDDHRMDIGRRRISRKRTKSPKPLKDGKFLFLPYKFENKSDFSLSVDASKTKQRGRFIGRNGYITSLEKQHHVCINMITSKTTEQVTKTLKNAKAGIGNIKIHNLQDLSKQDDGEWILVRQKKGENQTNTVDIETLLDELTNRWESFFNIQKRKHEDEEEEYPNKK
ncbi:unnamed protein product [Rotaria sordida]|uniref:Uncharacterized protein n=1 Tax=Rotaria sordida TaxID=392033 RepID=A0A814QMZ3_9BILA|nr:unnamed protein product [Rotaria sordida]CAF3964777.1 unnamed protein product [Rotaria sordida]